MKSFELYENICKKLTPSQDVIVHDFEIKDAKAKLVYIENMCNKQLIDSAIMTPFLKIKKLPNKNIIDFLLSNLLSDCSATKEQDVDLLVTNILSGFAVIFLEYEFFAITISSQGYEKRAISEPPTAAVVKGPREGFVEDISVNISLIRRRIKSPSLSVSKITIGQQTQTSVAIIYLTNIADDAVVTEVKRKLTNIKIDGIIDSFYVEEILQNKKNTIFKQIGSSEKPDVVAGKLLEGRVAIVVEGSPIVLTVPFIFIEDLQSAEDYYSQSTRSTFLRIIRVFGILIGILLPGTYVATQVFHYRLLPINFLISLLDTVQGLAFPPLIEILFVLFIFDILNEASVRMPKHLGMALSIIGALVLGDTAVQAGLVSPPAILVVAISGITIYTVPDQVGTMSLVRLGLTIVGGVAGYYGLLIASIFLFWYMCGIQSFGAPYLAPYAPNIPSDKKDALFKKPLKQLVFRPKSIPNKNPKKLNTGRKV